MSQVKNGDYIYLHVIDDSGILKGISRGIYKAHVDEDSDVFILVDGIAFQCYLFESQYIKLIPNKINKLLYREVI